MMMQEIEKIKMTTLVNSVMRFLVSINFWLEFNQKIFLATWIVPSMMRNPHT